MILNYDEFHFLNESFQSPKLRQIISQYGKPKYEADNKFLYDLRDDEIAGVFTWDEWYEYHKENPKSFCIFLKNDYYLGITNPDILTDYFDDSKNEEEFKKEIERRRDERHIGNELNGLNKWDKKDAYRDRTNDDFRKKKDEIIHSRNIEKIKNILAGHEVDFIDALRNLFEENASEVEFDTGLNCIEENEFEFLNKLWYVCMEYYSPSSDDSYSHFGGRYCDISIPLDKCMIGYNDVDENQDLIIDDLFDIKELIDDEKLLNKLFANYEEKDVECGIDDPYAYYGVKRSDFF